MCRNLLNWGNPICQILLYCRIPICRTSLNCRIPICKKKKTLLFCKIPMCRNLLNCRNPMGKTLLYCKVQMFRNFNILQDRHMQNSRPQTPHKLYRCLIITSPYTHNYMTFIILHSSVLNFFFCGIWHRIIGWMTLDDSGRRIGIVDSPIANEQQCYWHLIAADDTATLCRNVGTYFKCTVVSTLTI